MSLSALLDKTCSVERQTVALDATGANVPTWATRLSGIACALGPHDPRPSADFQRDGSLAHYKVTTAVDLSATTADRILINGLYYLVTGYKRASNFNICPEAVYVTYVTLRT